MNHSKTSLSNCQETTSRSGRSPTEPNREAISCQLLSAALALILAIAVVVSGCGAPAVSAPKAVDQAAGQTAALTLPVNIDAKTTNGIRNRDDVILLDVREDDEFKSGHIPGAEWIPLGQLSSRLSELPKDKTIVAVCRSGNRSGQATDLLRKNGFDAHNMQGGMNSWVQEGLEVEK